MKIGILRETKVPSDKRVALPPLLCKEIIENYPDIEIFVQPDNYRSYTDDEYKVAGIELKEYIGDCDVLLGVKEVEKSKLIPGKTYFFFSHTAKKQGYNRDLLRTLIEKKIRMVDYEYLVDEKNERVVAFGRWAGIVGAYNAILTYGKRFQRFDLLPAWKCRNKEDLFKQLEGIETGNEKFLISGGGRVASGAMETLSVLGLEKVSPEEYLNQRFEKPVYTQLNPWDYVKRLDGQSFDLHHFFNFPEEYETIFLPYTKATDVFIACHFWDPRSPVFMTTEDMQANDFKIQVIADVSCDVGGPIPSTIRASSIADPVYGYNPKTGKEGAAYEPGNVSVMAVDNLPGEIPRDASLDFGTKLMKEVIPHLAGNENHRIIDRATITSDGKLTQNFAYLEDFLKGLE